jgi:uncharacterized protein with PIN domain
VIVDTSIVVALAASEPSCGWIRTALDAYPNERLRMSWVNIAEAGMVLDRVAPGASAQLEQALAALGIEPLEADFSLLRIAITARSRFPLNFGDCFAYAHAHERDEALITLDADFLATDLAEVLHPKRS